MNKGLEKIKKKTLFWATPTAIENSLNFGFIQNRAGQIINRPTVRIVSITCVDVVKTTFPETAKDMTLKSLKVDGYQ
jgi:hypothetical protein